MQREQLLRVVHQGGVGGALAVAPVGDADLAPQLGQPRVPQPPEPVHVPELRTCKPVQYQPCSLHLSLRHEADLQKALQVQSGT